MAHRIDREMAASDTLESVKGYMESKARSKENFLPLGKAFLEIKRSGRFKQEGFSDFNEYIDSKGFGSKSHVYNHMDVYATYIEQLGFSEETLKSIGISKLVKILQHVGENKIARSQYETYFSIADNCPSSRLKRKLELADEDEDNIEPTSEETEEFSRSIRAVTNPEEARAEIDRLSLLFKNNPVKERIKKAKILARKPIFARLVKERARYICEICGAAPFLQKNGLPFAEAHHIFELRVTRIDDPRHMLCVCATCHRVIHYGNDAALYNRQGEKECEVD